MIEHCTEALEIEPNNVKALFRRGKAHIGAWSPNEARADLKKVPELDASLLVTCTKELKNLERLEKEKDNADKDKLRHVFCICGLVGVHGIILHGCVCGGNTLRLFCHHKVSWAHAFGFEIT